MRKINEISIDPKSIIKNGYGEFIIYQVNESGERFISEGVYSKAFAIVDRFSPLSCIKNKYPEKYQNRYELIRSALKEEIGENIEIAFIPRTLYELTFLKKSINEDIKNNQICALYNTAVREQPDLADKVAAYEKKRNCLHQGFFKSDPENNNLDTIKRLSFRVNTTLIKKISADSTFADLVEYSNQLEQFFIDHHKKCEDGSLKLKNANTGTSTSPTENFGYARIADFMGLRSKIDIAIINHAVLLECSAIAQSSLMLYRGAESHRETTIENECVRDGTLPKDVGAFSYSYGAGLFAGSVYDPGATAYRFMINIDKDAYAIPIPIEQLLNDSIFYIPLSHTITQLLGKEEYFHGRTKTWVNSEISGGVQSAYCTEKRDDLLQSKRSKEECIRLYQEAFKNAYILKKGCAKKIDKLFRLFQEDKITDVEWISQAKKIRDSFKHLNPI